MAYGINDMKQAASGALIASIIVVILRTEPISIDPQIGLAAGLAWIFIVTKPFMNRRGETKVHAAGNTVVTLAVTSVLSLIFGLVTMQTLQSFAFFGSTPWVMMMIALPTASFWDRFNITNQYDRWYYRRRGR